MMNRIRILVVDDHPVVRKGITCCLARFSQFDVAGEASDGKEALLQCGALKPHVVLMDLDMPGMSGLTSVELLRKQFPEIKILILTMHSRTEYVLRMIRSGATGYLLKNCPVEELVHAIEQVYSGHSCFSPHVASIALDRFVRGNHESDAAGMLTCREREVLIQIAEGLSNKEIAHCLGVGVRTIETHRERIMHKLNLHSVAALTKFAIVRGMITLENTMAQAV